MNGGRVVSAAKRILKVLVVGEKATGKSCLIRQYTKGIFSEFYKLTIGVDFANKEFAWDDQTIVSLQLWDIAGHERHGSMTHVYYQEAVGAFVVFDLTQPLTLNLVAEWKKDIDTKVFTSEAKPIPCLLLGNKIDLCPGGRWDKTYEEAEAIASDLGFIEFFETSAKDGTNIENGVHTLVKFIIDNNIEPRSANDDEGVNLTAPPHRRESGGCCH